MSVAAFRREGRSLSPGCQPRANISKTGAHGTVLIFNAALAQRLDEQALVFGMLLATHTVQAAVEVNQLLGQRKVLGTGYRHTE